MLFGKSRFVTDPSHVGEKSKDQEFDFVIIGGGTAGCVLASRLTEDSSLRVLLLESGGSGKSLLFSRIPSAFSLLFHTKYVYELHTEPQTFANEKNIYWPRGKMLGGCSSINAQMAQYGAPGDFDEWAEITGDDSWSWKNFHKYFTKLEKYTADPEYPNVDVGVKGSEGPVAMGYFSSITQSSKDFITSCNELGIPLIPDFNTTGGTRGVNRLMTYVDKNCTRVSAETAYLTEDVLARPNLIVALHAHVTQIIFDTANNETRAVGVEFAKSKNGTRYRAQARKEVILSAGAVHSPHILLLSGVGSAKDLELLGKTVIHDLPGVGSHLVDHPVVDLQFKDKLNACPKHIKPKSIPEVFKALGSVIEYFSSHKGPIASNIGEAAAFVRSDDPALFAPSDYSVKLHDSTSAVDSPDLEIFTTPFAYKNHARYMFPVHTIGLHVCLLRPSSTGSIRLKSNNPWDNPIMDPRYLEEPEDTEKLVRGMRLVLDIARTGPLASRLDQNDKNPLLDHDLHDKTDEELREIVKERVETLYHPAGSCRMAPLDAGGVVDSKLRVHGIRALRVCDASIFPSIVSGHTAGAVYAIAEKLADLLKEEYASAKNT